MHDFIVKDDQDCGDDINMDGPADTIADSQDAPGDTPDDQGSETESRSVSPGSCSIGLASNNVCKICHCGEEVRSTYLNSTIRNIIVGRITKPHNTLPLLW